MYCKTVFFFVIDTNHASDNSPGLRKSLSERIYKLIMAINDKIRHEKIRYDFKREAAKVSVLRSGKNDKYEFNTGEEILPSDQSKIIEQTNFKYSPLGKVFEKQIKAIEKQGITQVETIGTKKDEK